MSNGTATKRHARGGTPLVRSIKVAVVRGPDTGKSAAAREAHPLTLGTAADNDLVLGDPTVSRYHVEVVPAERGLRVKDLGSLNGTFIGRVLVDDATVPPGTRLSIGETVVELGEASVVASAATEEAPEVPGLVAASDAMREVVRRVSAVASSDVPVLVQGETGTGKEVVARGIHALSERCDKPFEIVDCGSMPATLVASELFGHERGAFTGADQRRTGAFERADGGTIFLDEIGELPLEVQPALLGVLERRRFRTLGGTKEIDVDVRVVSATHRDIRPGVNQSTFRPDLYFRLAVARLTLPPLRERPDDIEPLVRQFVLELTGDPSVTPFGESALERLRALVWTGNVRELRNVVENALAMGTLEEDLGLAAEVSSRAETEHVEPYRRARSSVIARFEAEYLGHLIQLTGGNASEAARRAGMDRPYLLTLLRKHGLR